jgi:hypothetical protein
MTRTSLAVVVFLWAAVPAAADVTIKMSVTGSGLGRTGQTAGLTYIKGLKMRSEIKMGDRTQTTIFDLGAQKMYVFESGRKDADVWDMAEFSKQIGTTVNTEQMTASIKPNGQKKTYGTFTADGYDMEITVPAAMGGSKDMSMTVKLAGPVWIVKNGPGAAEYAAFYKAAAEKGWIFGDPRAAKGQPGQARAMAEMYRRFAEIGGIAYESDIKIGMSMSGGGSGMMGGLLGKLGDFSSRTLVEDVQSGPLADDLFSVPAGYKLNPRK